MIANSTEIDTNENQKHIKKHKANNKNDKNNGNRRSTNLQQQDVLEFEYSDDQQSSMSSTNSINNHPDGHQIKNLHLDVANSPKAGHRQCSSFDTAIIKPDLLNNSNSSSRKNNDNSDNFDQVKIFLYDYVSCFALN
jgi:hypothetical protein